MTATLLFALALALPAATSSALPDPPPQFFGIAPQTALTTTDVEYMNAGRIGSVRWPLSWATVQPTASGGYNWTGFDEVVERAARGNLRVLPFLYGTPRWLSRKPTTLPIDTARARTAWYAFVKAAVKRYGPGGEFWKEHAHEGVNYEPAIPTPTPIRTWQIWNEANFFYFAMPVSPNRYARLLKLSHQAIKSVDPRAQVLLSGLFGEPSAQGSRGMPATTFLQRLYAVPGIKADFDAVALHPYAVDTETLAEMAEGMRAVVLENHDAGTGLYITEMGWGSQNDFNKVAFEQGTSGQVRELRDSYRYLIANRGRLNLKGVYWFSWKDIQGSCSFCDSVGFFRRGARLKPKPAWHAFVALTGGRARP
ncbi:MAG: hypothetical protein WBM00_05525 [Solirubrobacterales bacterium]